MTQPQCPVCSRKWSTPADRVRGHESVFEALQNYGVVWPTAIERCPGAKLTEEEARPCKCGHAKTSHGMTGCLTHEADGRYCDCTEAKR